MSEPIINNTKLCKVISNRIYENLRLTMSNFDMISVDLIDQQIVETLTLTRLVDGCNWTEKLNYNGKLLNFNMLVFEVKKQIQGGDVND